MERLAAAVVNAFAFLALSDEATVNEDEACRMIEALPAELRLCTPAERAALEQAAHVEHARHRFRQLFDRERYLIADRRWRPRRKAQVRGHDAVVHHRQEL